LYYLVSNLVTFGQQWVIRQRVNDDKLRVQIANARKKPVTKSKFQARMEAAMKQQQAKKGK
jgi:YidC/Oxa1 family membrane protein insertase